MYWFIYYLSFENFLHIFKEIRLYPPPIYTHPSSQFLPTHSSLNSVSSFLFILITCEVQLVLSLGLGECPDICVVFLSTWLPSPPGSAAALLSQGAQSISTHFQPPAGDIVSGGEQAASSSPLPRGTQLHTGSLTQLHTKHKTLERKAFPWGVLIKLIKCMSGS